MGCGARPAILGGGGGDPGSGGVILHITQGNLKVRVRKYAGMKPSLPEMSTSPLANVDRLRVPAIGSSKQPGERIIPLRDGHEMDVIRHQTVRQDSYPSLRLILADQS